MTRRADPSRPVDVQPDVALRRVPRLSGVETHPVADRGSVGPGVAADRELAVDRRLDGRPRAREDEVEPVARRPALERAVLGEGLAEQPVVIGQHLRIAVAERLEQARRALDVGEHQGDGPRRKAGVGRFRE